MKKITLSKSDIRFHFKENKTQYFMLFSCICIGIIIGFVIVFSSSNFVKLLTSKNKVLYNFINGTADYMGLFWKKFLSFLIPSILIFLLSLNYYLGLISYLFITYQSAIFVLSCAAVIKTYAVSGFFNVLFVMMPINFIFFAILSYLIVICLKRSKQAQKYKQFNFGMNDMFLVKLSLCMVLLIMLAFVACIIYPLFLRSSIFIIF